MHLFGGAKEPHLTHFEAQRERGGVILRWDVRRAPAMRWRVLRSQVEFAKTPDALPGSGQALISDSADCGARDDQATGEETYYYTVFAQDAQGAWQRQVKVKVDPRDKLRWQRPEHPSFEHAGPTDGYIDMHVVEARELTVAKEMRNYSAGDKLLGIQTVSRGIIPAYEPKLDDD